MSSIRVAIIGGGLGGLATAYYLQQLAPGKCDVTIFEAGSRLGGKILTQTFTKAHILHEAGAAELYDYSQLGPDPLRELIEEMGLRTNPLQGPTVILGDHLLSSEADIARAFGDSTLNALREFTARARSFISPELYYESDWEEDNDDPLAKESFRELLKTVKDPIARKYIEVAVHSDLATEPERTNAVYGLQNYLMNEPDYMRLYTIVGGIESLPREVAKRVSARILLNHSITRVERLPNEMYQVTSRQRGELRSEEFDFVVVALPNNWIPMIEWGGERLADAMQRHHKHYDYPAHYLRASILFEKPFWREHVSGAYFMHDAFGGCCIYDESSRNGGNSEYGVLGWLVAGEAAVNLNNLPDDEIIAQVLDSLPKTLRSGRELFLEGRIYRWIGSVNGLPAGFPMLDPEMRHCPEPQDHPWLFTVGDYLFDSTLNGVLDSADFVAEWILEELSEM